MSNVDSRNITFLFNRGEIMFSKKNSLEKIIQKSINH